MFFECFNVSQKITALIIPIALRDDACKLAISPPGFTESTQSKLKEDVAMIKTNMEAILVGYTHRAIANIEDGYSSWSGYSG